MNWAGASGRFFAATGRDLRDQPVHLIYEYGYFILSELTRRTKEEAEAMEKLEDTFAGLDFEDDTGLPSIARRFGPADDPFGFDTSAIPPGF